MDFVQYHNFNFPAPTAPPRTHFCENWGPFGGGPVCDAPIINQLLLYATTCTKIINFSPPAHFFRNIFVQFDFVRNLKRDNKLVSSWNTYFPPKKPDEDKMKFFNEKLGLIKFNCFFTTLL